MTFELMFTRGPMKNRTMRIPAKGTLRIGAGKDCEITVADPTVSRYHCYVELREGQPWVGDLASDNGLVVNGGVVRECPIEAQDVVTLGSSEFKVMPVADKPKSSGFVKVLPWLLLLGVLGFIAYQRFVPKRQPETPTHVQAPVVPEPAPPKPEVPEADEASFIQSLHAVYADGAVSDQERTELENRRKECNVAPVRAVELEQLVQGLYKKESPDAKYFDFLVELAKQGKTLDAERGALEKLRNDLKLSEERVRQLEELLRVGGVPGLKCPCPPGTKHLKRCPCGGVANCSCLVVEPCGCNPHKVGYGLMHRAPEKCPCDGAPNCKCKVVTPTATADDFTVLFGAGVCKAAKNFEPTVQSNMADMGKALAKKETTREVVADAAFKMADKHQMDPYQRFLYMKGAFILYVRDIRPGEAMRTWQHIHFMLPDLDPRVAVEMFELAVKDLPDYVDPILNRALARERARVPFAAVLDELRAKPTTALTAEDRLAIADNAAALGEWGLFARSMASAGDKWKKLMSLETSPTATATQLVQLGDLWWNRAEDRPELLRTAFRSRAAERYAQALQKKDALAEDVRPRLETRIKTAYADVESVPYAGDSEYILIDLSGGPDAVFYPVRPIAVDKFTDRKTGVITWKDAYKTKGLVLKRIKSGSFMSHERKFHVTRTFYMGIFEVTMQQFALVMGSSHSRFKDDKRKPESVNYNYIRGDEHGYEWPMSSEVDESSFLGRLRRKTGLAFDLPTEIQWEYACRAGKTGEFDGETDPKAMDKLGRYNGNGGVVPDPKGAKDKKGNIKMIDGGPSVVGSYRPNPWGLYDMHGNVLEWCLDRYPLDGCCSRVRNGYGPVDGQKECVTDPKGGIMLLGWGRFLRGGNWQSPASDCNASSRWRKSAHRTGHDGGFRLVCPVR